MTSLFGFISLTALPLAEFTAIVATVPLCEIGRASCRERV